MGSVVVNEGSVVVLHSYLCMYAVFSPWTEFIEFFFIVFIVLVPRYIRRKKGQTYLVENELKIFFEIMVAKAP